MPFPKVRHCLICEGIHQEGHRKLTVLGLYGVAPDAKVRIGDLAKPIASLTFLLVCGPSEGGTFAVYPTISHDDGTRVSSFKPGSVTIEKAETSYFGVSAINQVFPTTGRYVFILAIDNEVHFRTAFEVEAGLLSDV